MPENLFKIYFRANTKLVAVALNNYLKTHSGWIKMSLGELKDALS